MTTDNKKIQKGSCVLEIQIGEYDITRFIPNPNHPSNELAMENPRFNWCYKALHNFLGKIGFRLFLTVMHMDDGFHYRRQGRPHVSQVRWGEGRAIRILPFLCLKKIRSLASAQHRRASTTRLRCESGFFVLFFPHETSLRVFPSSFQVLSQLQDECKECKLRSFTFGKFCRCPLDITYRNRVWNLPGDKTNLDNF